MTKTLRLICIIVRCRNRTAFLGGIMTGSVTPIVSALPGRIRLRHPLLRQPGRNRDLADRIAALNGLRVADSSTTAGSLLILYDPARTARTAAEALVAAAAADALNITPPPAAPSPPPGTGRVAAGQTATRALNRAAKIGMMGSMAATLAALGVGKRLHAGAGAVFVALMLVHMTIQRKRLFQ